jgi:hypothetical protein
MPVTPLSGLIDANVFVPGYTPTGSDVGAEIVQVLNKLNETLALANTNEAGVATNVSDIADAVADIASNLAAIAINAAAIEELAGNTVAHHRQAMTSSGYNIPSDFDYGLLQAAGDALACTINLPAASGLDLGRQLRIVSTRVGQTDVASGGFGTVTLAQNDAADFVVIQDNTGTGQQWAIAGVYDDA